MRLVSFSVKNFRSITVAHKIATGKMTVLVGKNNEGKSNLIKALTLAMEIMVAYSENPKITAKNLPSIYPRIDYSWDRDYPIEFRTRTRDLSSIITLEFELSQNELADLRDITGIRLNSEIIPIRIALHSSIKIDIPQKGSPAFKSHALEIIEYVSGRIRFYPIQAVRTAKDAIEVVDRIISFELKNLEKEAVYLGALQTISNVQQKMLNSIARNLTPSLKVFLPTVKKISLNSNLTKQRSMFSKDYEIIIDDGTATNLQTKGDGIKSLVALAMLSLYNKDNDYATVISIEEPESHLHPEAIHQLNETIIELAEQNQIILTTHSPLFINRNYPSSNVIVSRGVAKSAKNINDIRDELGVLISDNLTSAEYLLIVEGEDDKTALLKILPFISKRIREALHKKVFQIVSLDGASNLSFYLTQYRNACFNYHVLLDNDSSGREAFLVAEKKRLITSKNVTFTICNGSPEAEFEDCLSVDAYKKVVLDQYGVLLTGKSFKTNRKWSERVKDCFLSQGKIWNDSIKQAVKLSIVENLPEDASNCLCQPKSTFITSLVRQIEEMI